MLISDGFRRAQKQHTCYLCRETINKGSRYNYEFHKDNEKVFELHSHCSCEFIKNELIEWINAWDGISFDEFHYGVKSFCEDAICKNCIFGFVAADSCFKEKSYCLDKVGELLKKYELVRVCPKGYSKMYWALKPRKIPYTTFPGENKNS